MAEASGYDALFITDHGRVWSERELAALTEMCTRVRVLPGIEISLPDGQDLLVLGADNPVYESMTTPSEVLAQACADGYLTIIARPYRDRDVLSDYCALADAVETLTCTQPDPEQVKRACEYAQARNMAELYASDALGLNYMNKFWIETAAGFETAQEFRHLVLARQYRNNRREVAEPLPPTHKAASIAELSDADMMELCVQPTPQSTKA
jgi:predicted metal-dependent phosphoesterase TrpH